MMSRRTCPNGHTYFKSSSCPVCPVCEKHRAPAAAYMVHIGAPARRALEREGIVSLRKLSRWSVAGLLSLHGVGPSAIPPLRRALRTAGLTFAPKKKSK